jgi:hypothetical protein
MIGMIGRLGEASPKRGRVCALWHLLGLSLSAAALGVALGLAGAWLRWAGAQLGVALFTPASIGIGIGLLALICGLRELGVLSFPLPQRQRQVPREWWYTMGTRRASFLWGVALGAGFLTFVQYPVYYVLLALALVSPPATGGLLLAASGVAQGLVLIARTVQSASGPPSVSGDSLWSSRAHAWGGWAALAFAGYVLTATWLTGSALF